MASLNDLFTIINFHLNDKWLLCAYYVAGTLLDGSTMMSQYRYSPGLVEQLNTQLTVNGN